MTTTNQFLRMRSLAGPLSRAKPCSSGIALECRPLELGIAPEPHPADAASQRAGEQLLERLPAPGQDGVPGLAAVGDVPGTFVQPPGQPGALDGLAEQQDGVLLRAACLLRARQPLEEPAERPGQVVIRACVPPRLGKGLV